jgi:hypothetical protein
MADINGIPYVEATDLVSAYPGVSLALATELDTQLGSKLDVSAYLPAKILQVVSTTKTDVFTTTNTAFTDITNLSVSITPSSISSTILVFASVSGASTSASSASRAYLRLVRDSTDIAIADAAGNRTRMTGNISTRNLSADVSLTASFHHLDSPNTTSATTYKVQASTNGGTTLFINRIETDTDLAAVPRTVSSITVMEVSA